MIDTARLRDAAKTYLDSVYDLVTDAVNDAHALAEDAIDTVADELEARLGGSAPTVPDNIADLWARVTDVVKPATTDTIDPDIVLAEKIAGSPSYLADDWKPYGAFRKALVNALNHEPGWDEKFWRSIVKNHAREAGVL
jgi:hypothetical protein